MNNYNAPKLTWFDFKYVYAIIVVRASADNTIDIKDIEIDKNHIDNFQLESSTGTKKMKEKFYKNAASERNAYIEKELVKFENKIKNKEIKLKDEFIAGVTADESSEI